MTTSTTANRNRPVSRPLTSTMNGGRRGQRYEARTADGEFHDGVTIERSNGAKQVYTVDEDGNRVKPVGNR